MSLFPSQIIEYLYCPRYTYFEYVLAIPQNEDKFKKVQRGRMIHDEKLEWNKTYLRKKIGVKDKLLDQYLTNNELRGKVDEVLFLKDGTAAPLDYKFAEFKDKIYSTYKQQLFCYALLIEHNFNIPVNRGYLVYTRSKNKLITVEISQKEKDLIAKSSLEINKIIQENHYPKPTKYKRRCLSCTYRNICTQ